MICEPGLYWRFCPECDAERAFEIPDCAGLDEAQCPDIACVDCGTALSVGLELPVAPRPAIVVYSAA